MYLQAEELNSYDLQAHILHGLESENKQTRQLNANSIKKLLFMRENAFNLT